MFSISFSIVNGISRLKAWRAAGLSRAVFPICSTEWYRMLCKWYPYSSVCHNHTLQYVGMWPPTHAEPNNKHINTMVDMVYVLLFLLHPPLLLLADILFLRKHIKLQPPQSCGAVVRLLCFICTPGERVTKIGSVPPGTLWFHGIMETLK